MIRFMPRVTSRSPIGVAALALLLAACSGSGGTTKKPEEDDEDGDGTGAPGAGGTPNPNDDDDDDDNKDGQPNMPVPPPPDDDDDTNPDPGPTTIDQKPTELELTPNTATVEENSNPRILATVTLTDADGGKNILTLTGTDSGVFEIRNNNQLWLTGSLDFETDQSHSIIVTVNTNSGLQETFTLTVRNINDSPPKITSPTTGTALPEEISVAKDKVIYIAIGTPDVSTHKITWTIGGTDGNLFTIDRDTGEVTFKSVTTPDFEDKESYSFIVTATVGAQSASKTVTIKVTDIDEVVQLPSLFTNVQNANPYLAEAITYSTKHEVAYFARQTGDSAVITSQDQAGLMTIQIDPMDSSRYEVIIPTARRFDFETEFTNDHSYDFTVQLTRGGQTDSQKFSLPFKNVFGPNDGDRHNTKAQKFVPSANQWRELIGNEAHPTFDATRDAGIINLMQSQGGYDPSFLFYFGNAAKDKVSGTANDDIIYGNGGDDELYGEMGSDTLYGGTGSDILDGGFRGENSLTGGRGADKFILYKGNISTDTITDFNRSEGDKILYDHTTNSAANLAAIGLRKKLNSDNNLQLVDAGNNHIYMIFDGLNQLSDITITDFELI